MSTTFNTQSMQQISVVPDEDRTSGGGSLLPSCNLSSKLPRRSLFLAVFAVLSAPHVALAQSDSIESELRHVRKFYQNNASQLKYAQQMLKAYGTFSGTAGGKWNKATENAFRKALQTYIAIGGRGPDWGVNRPSDTPRFIKWIGEALSSNASGSDYPD